MNILEVTAWYSFGSNWMENDDIELASGFSNSIFESYKPFTSHILSRVSKISQLSAILISQIFMISVMNPIRKNLWLKDAFVKNPRPMTLA